MTAAALETLKIMDEERIVDRARDTGTYFKDALKQLKLRHRCIAEVRGRGLLLGIQLKNYGNVVPKNNVIVMGDNTSKSYDSGDFGMLSMSQISGHIRP